MGYMSMTRQISLRLPDKLLGRIDRQARQRRLRRTDLIREALEFYLDGPLATVDERPYERVRDLVGSLSGGLPDLGQRHRHYLRGLIDDRR
jgi:Arc/MetJ-type ribon-helix-helix transcriptional regulator